MRGIHQDTEAREVMEAKVPLIIVQFQQDYFFNPHKYPNFYGRILSAVPARGAEQSFFFLNLPGDHDCAEKLATHSRWGRLRHRAARRVAKFLDSCDRRLSMPCRWLLQLPIAWTDGISATDAWAVPDMVAASAVHCMDRWNKCYRCVGRA